jgi:hypothetical protein
MAEAMAQNERLAEEYACILISYIQPEGNYLDYCGLQQGVLWGIGRLARTHPRYTRNSTVYLVAHMQSDNPIVRGLAVWAASPPFGEEVSNLLEQLSTDLSKFVLYRDGFFKQYTIGQLARDALALIDKSDSA